MNVELIPLVGIDLDGKTIRLGEERTKIQLVLGQPECVHKNSLYYFRNKLRIDFDRQGQAAFIELLGGPDGALQPVIFGMAAFQAEPEAVVERLKERNGSDILDTENGYSYAFQSLGVGLYRESVPENVQEMIEEAQADGHPLSAEDIEYETRRTHWATIGVGTKDYYQ